MDLQKQENLNKHLIKLKAIALNDINGAYKIKKGEIFKISLYELEIKTLIQGFKDYSKFNFIDIKLLDS